MGPWEKFAPRYETFLSLRNTQQRVSFPYNFICEHKLLVCGSFADEKAIPSFPSVTREMSLYFLFPLLPREETKHRCHFCPPLTNSLLFK